MHQKFLTQMMPSEDLLDLSSIRYRAYQNVDGLHRNSNMTYSEINVGHWFDVREYGGMLKRSWPIR